LERSHIVSMETVNPECADPDVDPIFLESTEALPQE